jgi:hypothetical protein
MTQVLYVHINNKHINKINKNKNKIKCLKGTLVAEIIDPGSAYS